MLRPVDPALGTGLSSSMAVLIHVGLYHCRKHVDPIFAEHETIQIAFHLAGGRSTSGIMPALCFENKYVLKRENEACA
jgi:hypothetical protein